MTSQPVSIPAYQLRVDEVFAGQGTDARRGLSAEEAGLRQLIYGMNELTPEKPVPSWKRLPYQFRDSLVILLLIAATISAVLWLHERKSALPYEAISIYAIVVLNALMGYLQEARAPFSPSFRRWAPPQFGASV